MQRKALRRGEELGFQQKGMFKKGKSAVESDPKKNWSEAEARES